MDRNMTTVEVSWVIDKINEHMNCRKYHIIDGKEATCLDVIEKEIMEVSGNSSPKSKKVERG